MNEDFADQGDRETVTRLNRRAAELFARHGIDFATAKRCGGWTNATWLAGGLALRFAVRVNGDKIRREAQLATILPPEVGYPQVIETGVLDGYEWSLSREIAGRSLGEVWPVLNWNERMNALRELWAKAEAVHGVNGTEAASLARKNAWFNAENADEVAACLSRLATQGVLKSQQVENLEAALTRFWQALVTAERVLNHGDLTLDNALWHDGHVVSLLDFEYAVMAPVELDLKLLVKTAFSLAEGEMSAEDADGIQAMRDVVTGLAAPVFAQPGGKERLAGYAILLDLWRLEDWLAHPEGEGPMEDWQPYRMVVSLADGNHGYLAALFDKLKE